MARSLYRSLRTRAAAILEAMLPNRNGAGMRILIVRLGAVGDCVHVLPALTALREHFPRAHIGWLIEDKSESLIRSHPLLDEVIVLARRRWASDSRRLVRLPRAVRDVVRSIANLRTKRYDVAIDFQGNCRSGLWAFLSGARERIGFAGHTQREANYLLMRRHIRPPRERLHKVEKNLSLLRGIGIHPGRLKPVLPPRDQEAKTVQKWADMNGLVADLPTAAIHPGVSRFGFFKRWPAEAYAQLARRLDQEGVQSVITWGPGEREEAERIRTLAAGTAILGPETRSLLALAEVLRRCQLFVGSDSGPLHLASAAGTPTIALFGPKDPVRYGPLGAPSQIVRAGVECSPCLRRSCSDPVCMTTLSPDRVATAALALLRANGSPPSDTASCAQ